MLKILVMSPLPLVVVMFPILTSTSAFAFVAVVVELHAVCKKRNSLARLKAATKVEALLLCAAVVRRLAASVPPVIRDFVISVALVPSTLAERQMRKRAAPRWE